MVHDRDLAWHLVEGLRAAYIGAVSLPGCSASVPHANGSSPSITLQSPAGEGWRSKVVAKKKAKQLAEEQLVSPHDNKVTATAADVSDVSAEQFASLSFESEVEARMEAIGVGIKAQVSSQLCGSPQHSATGLISNEEHFRGNAARHSFRNTAPFAQTSLKDLKKQSRGRSAASASDEGQDHHKVVHEGVAAQFVHGATETYPRTTMVPEASTSAADLRQDGQGSSTAQEMRGATVTCPWTAAAPEVPTGIDEEPHVEIVSVLDGAAGAQPDEAQVPADNVVASTHEACCPSTEVAAEVPLDAASEDYAHVIDLLDSAAAQCFQKHGFCKDCTQVQYVSDRASTELIFYYRGFSSREGHRAAQAEARSSIEQLLANAGLQHYRLFIIRK